MKTNHFILLALGLMWNTLCAQEIAPVAPSEAPQKGSMAFTFHLGRSSFNQLRFAPGAPVRSTGLTQTFGLGLHFLRPNSTRHIISLDWYGESSAIGSNFPSNVFGGRRGSYIGYEFRKYFPMGDGKWQWYLGGWAQSQGTIAFVPDSPNTALVRVNAGLSAGVQYDIRKRFFFEGGVRAGLLSTEYTRDPLLGSQSQIGLGRYLLDARVGVGYRF